MRKKIIDIAEFHARLAGGARPKTAVRLAATDALTASDSEERIVSFVFSDNTVDRYGDVIDARGWQLDNFRKSPVALFGHRTDAAESVIGKARNVRVEGGRLIGEIEFAEAAVNPTAETVYQMVKGGFLTACSVGFAPVEWSLSKEKGRQGGIDFKRQELLEISVVPVPANPNAIALAKAAGIDVGRLGLARVPVISKKGLYSVSALAGLLAQLGWLEDDVEWEAEYEGDGSAVPQMLTDAMKLLGQVLIAMTVEEVSELLAEEDGGEPVIIVDDPVVMEGLTPAQRAFVAIARGLAGAHGDRYLVKSSVRLTKEAADRIKETVRKWQQEPRGVIVLDQNLELIRLGPDGSAVTGAAQETEVVGEPFSKEQLTALRAWASKIDRAGKVLSTADEKTLREAHDMITKGYAMIKDMVDAAGGDDSEDAAKALRERQVRLLAI